MIRLSWLQFRTSAYVVTAALAVVAVLLAVTGPHFADLYDGYGKALAACAGGGPCQPASIDVGTLDQQLKLLATALVAVPALLGAFWAAPLVARELETGTHRLVWTQSVTRTRWLAVKLAVVGAASVAATGLLSWMVTWWSSPMDRVAQNQFGAGMFGQRNIAPIGYAALAFAIGVAAGLLLRRTLPAMAATLVAFTGIRMVFAFWIRPHLHGASHLNVALDPTRTGLETSNGGPLTLATSPPHLPGSWIYSNTVVDSHGQALSSAHLASTCPKLMKSLPPLPGSGRSSVRTTGPSDDMRNMLHDCVT